MSGYTTKWECRSHASHWIVWRTSSTLFLIAQRTATSGHSIWTSCSTVVLLQTLWFCVNQMHVVVSLGNALHVGSKSCLYKFTEVNFLSVGSQLPPRTLNILIDWLKGVHVSFWQMWAAYSYDLISWSSQEQNWCAYTRAVILSTKETTSNMLCDRLFIAFVCRFV